MENSEIIVIILAAVLPVYPALWTIYQKIGKYDALCVDFARLRDEYRERHYKKDEFRKRHYKEDHHHGSRDYPDN